MCHLSTIVVVRLTGNTCLMFPEVLLMPSCRAAIMGWADCVACGSALTRPTEKDGACVRIERRDSQCRPRRCGHNGHPNERLMLRQGIRVVRKYEPKD